MKRYNKSELTRKSNWIKLAKMSEEEVLELYTHWKEVEDENKTTRTKNIDMKNEIIKEIKEVLTKHNIKIEKFSKSNIFKSLGYVSWFNKNINEVVSNRYPTYTQSLPSMDVGSIEVDDFRLSINSSPMNIVEGHKKLQQQYKRYQSDKIKKTTLFTESVKYAIENDIDISNMEEKAIINSINEHAENKWVEENYPEGTEVYLKHVCYECDKWIVGERRCSCGNRRVALTVEGSLLDGYWAYPEGY